MFYLIFANKIHVDWRLMYFQEIQPVGVVSANTTYCQVCHGPSVKYEYNVVY